MVTYSDLIQFIMMLCSIITLVIVILDRQSDRKDEDIKTKVTATNSTKV